MIWRVGWGDRRDERRWQRELAEQLRNLPTYEGQTPDGGPVTPVGRSLPRPARPGRGRRRRRQQVPADPAGRPASARSERGRTVVTVGVTLAVVAAALGASASPISGPLRGLLGWDDRGEASSYAFLATDPLTGDPVTWSSCDAIELVVNPDGAPGDWEALVDDAVAEVADAVGLEMRVTGTTDDRPGGDRTGRFDDRPVLIAWATPEEEPELAGDTIGVAGPRTGDSDVFVTGTVVLDGPQFEELDDAGGRVVEKAVVMHELGHLLGLDHVEDEKQLMYPTTTFQSTFGTGDLEGLRRLGEGPCR